MSRVLKALFCFIVLVVLDCELSVAIDGRAFAASTEVTGSIQDDANRDGPHIEAKRLFDLPRRCGLIDAYDGAWRVLDPETCLPLTVPGAKNRIYGQGLISTAFANAVSEQGRLNQQKAIDASNYASLAEAVAVIGGSRAVLTISTKQDVAENLIIPETILLSFTKEGRIIIATGKSLLISGSIEAGMGKIFGNAWSGQGTVSFFMNKTVSSFYPQWWGAMGDGSNDDTASIQAALSAASTRGAGAVVLPSGTFKISDKLVLSDNIELRGGGVSTVVHQNTPSASGIIPASNNYIHDFTLRGAYGRRDESPGIRAAYTGTQPDVIHRDMTDPSKWNGYAMRVERMLIRDWGNNGVWAGPHNRIEHNTFVNNYNEAVITFGDYTVIDDNEISETKSWGIDVNASYCQVTNNRLSNVGSAAAFPWDMGGICVSTFHLAAGALKNEISGNTITNSDGHGILVIDGDGNPSEGNVVRDNRLTNVARNLTVSNFGAIEVVNSHAGSLAVRHTIVSGNTILNSKGAGIELIAPNDVQVDRNIIDGVPSTPGHGDGIRVELATPRVATSGSGVTITNNTISNFYRYGINVDEVHDVSISGNQIQNGKWDGPYIPLVRLKDVDNYRVTGNRLVGNPNVYDGIIKLGRTGRGTISNNAIEGCHVPVAYIPGLQPSGLIIDLMLAITRAAIQP